MTFLMFMFPHSFSSVAEKGSLASADVDVEGHAQLCVRSVGLCNQWNDERVLMCLMVLGEIPGAGFSALTHVRREKTIVKGTTTFTPLHVLASDIVIK